MLVAQEKNFPKRTRIEECRANIHSFVAHERLYLAKHAYKKHWSQRVTVLWPLCNHIANVPENSGFSHSLHNLILSPHKSLKEIYRI